MNAYDTVCITMTDGTEINGMFVETVPDPILPDKTNLRIVCDKTGERAVVNHRWISSVKVA